MKCPHCLTEVQNENININTDLAQCQSCNQIFKVSENLEDEIPESFDINNPPNGTWIRNEMNQIVLGATTKSPIAFFLIPFMIVWSGGSIGMIYGLQIINGEFNLFSSLFGIPFLLGSILFWSLTFMTIGGKVELKLNKEGGNIFTGFGTIGLNKKFIWDDVSTIKESISLVNYPGNQGSTIILEGANRIKFGSGLSENRRYFIYAALKNFHSKVKANRIFA